MKIEIFDSFCPQLNRVIKVALDSESEDCYRDMFKKEFHIPLELQFLQKNATGVELFIDVGANIGLFSLSAASIGISTVAIEAITNNYILLVKALSENGLTNVIPFHLAASNDFTQVNLRGNSAWASIADEGVGDTPAIPLDNLLKLFDRGNPDLIKIDVEGHEIPVLQGLKEILLNARPMLIVEGNAWTARTHGGCRALISEIFQYGYELYMFNQDGTMRPVTMNHIQERTVVDYFAYPKGVGKKRAMPEIRIPSVDELIKAIEMESSGNDAQKWYTAQIIDEFESAYGADPRINSIRQKVSGYLNYK